MNKMERIDAASRAFDGKHGGMDDEWTETFDLACRFARRLTDASSDDGLCEQVIEWIEAAAAMEGDGY